MHGGILPRRACNPCGYTMKISYRYHRLLIYDVKGTTKIDGMFNMCNMFEMDQLVNEYTRVNDRSSNFN